jgi:hypothetical protein
VNGDVGTVNFLLLVLVNRQVLNACGHALISFRPEDIHFQ